MAEIRYGHREGPGKGREYGVAASQYISRRGGKFVKLGAPGHVTACASADTLVAGWAETPKDADGYNAWKSSGTAGADKVFVIYGLEDVFEMPCDESKASLCATYIGMGAKIVTSGSTYTTIQYAKIGTGTAASPLTIVDIDTTNKTVFVKIKPASKQAI
jgi:hypothetical protein